MPRDTARPPTAIPTLDRVASLALVKRARVFPRTPTGVPGPASRVALLELEGRDPIAIAPSGLLGVMTATRWT